MSTCSILQHLVLRRAAGICGGEETLSRILSVSLAELRHWTAGKAPAPLPIFLEAMKLVNDACHTGRQARAGDARTPATRPTDP